MKNRKVGSLVIGRNFRLSTAPRDCKIMLHGRIISVCTEIYCNKNGELIAFDDKLYHQKRSFYEYPCTSDNLYVYIVDK